MASVVMRCTLVGFSELLDWRPLCFVEALPPSCTCAACGLIRPLNVRFPCQHVLCERCCQQSVQNEDELVCPLDGRRCQKMAVSVQNIHVNGLLTYKVKCWNEQAGCQAVMAASRLSEHFHSKCRHHSTCCPKCSAHVLCSELNTHLLDDCKGSVMSALPSGQRGSNTAPIAGFTKLLDRSMADIAAGLMKIISENTAHKQTLSQVRRAIEVLKEGPRPELAEISQNRHDRFARTAVDHPGPVEMEVSENSESPRKELTRVSLKVKKLEETLKQELKSAAGRILADIKRNTGKIDAMHSDLAEASRETHSRLEIVMAQTSLPRTMHRFAVGGVANLQATTFRSGSTHFVSNRVYLRGYFMSPGVHLTAHAGTMSLRPWIVLHRGEHDDSLEWPIRMAVKFSAIHPDTAAERVDDIIHPACEIVSKAEAQDDEPWLRRRSAPSFLLSQLERDGFVKNDNLLLKYEFIVRRRLT